MDCSPDLVEDFEDLVEDFEDLHNVDFLCPFCHEVVELFNNDLQFSIDMHSQNDTHITAYKNFQENNIAQKDKPPDTVSKSLDRQKNNAFILDSILKSVSVDIAPLNHTSFGNDNINFLDTDTDLSKSLNDKLVLKESSCKLERLFMQLPTGFQYNIPYISMVGKKLFCYLCNCVIVASLDEVVLRTNLKKHLEGSHQQNYLKELIKLLPKEQIEDENYFILKLGRMMCKLCKVPIPITLSGLKSTFYNLIIHLRGKKHKTNLNTHFEDYSGLKQIFVQRRPKTIQHNKFYLTKNGECYKCVLCNKNISLSGQDVSQTRLKFIEHLNSNNHLNKVKIFENISLSLDYEYLKQKIYPLQSQVIEQNMKHIVKIDDKWFKCTLCAVQLEIFSEPSVTVSQFSQHLKSTKHKQNLKVANTENESNEKVNQVSQETSGNTNPKKCSNDDFDRLKTKLKGFPVPQIFDENKQFIIVYEKHFKCTLCEAILQVSPIPSITIENFTQHLQSKFHKQNEKKVDLMQMGNNDFSWEKLIGKNNIPDIIEQNKQFVVKNKTYMCILCNTELKISSVPLDTRSNFAQHFHLPSHKHKKIEYEKHLAESINLPEYFNQSKSVDTNPSTSTPNNEYGILEEAFGSFHQLQLVQENKQFIMKLKTHFKCSLCDVQLAVTSDPETNILLFSQHLESVFHKQNKQDLENHIVNENLSLRSSVNIALNSSSIDNECEFLSFEAALGTHYELELIKHNTQYLIKEGNFFKCTLCDLQIQLSSEIALNVLRLLQHLKSEIHIQNRTEHVFKYLLQEATTAETTNTLLTNFQKDYLYLKALLDPYPVPQFIEQNKKFIVKNGTHYKCTLCDSHLEVSFDPRFTRTNFALHLDCSSHEQKRIEYEKRIAQTANSVENLNTNGNVDMNPNISTSNDDFGVLKKIFGIFDELKLIQENKQFIVKLKKHVKCSLCDVQLSVSTDHEKNILLFSQHLESVFHKQNKRDRRNDIVVNSTSIENELQYLSLEAALGTYYELQVIKHNTQYLIIEGNLFKCTLCNSQFSVSSEIFINLLRLSLHLNSEVHKENRTEHVFKQLMQEAANSQNMNTPSNIDYLYLQALLDPYPTPQYVERNKKFIVKNGTHYKCTLCDSHLEVSFDPRFTRTNLALHLDCPSHKQKRIEYEKRIAQTANSVENLNTNGNVDMNPNISNSNNDFGVLKKIFGIFHELKLIQENKQFIVKLKKHVKCSLCDVQLSVSTDHEKNILLFSQHLESVFHKQNKRDRRNDIVVNSTSIENELQFLSLEAALGTYYELQVIKHNTQYLIIEGNLFKCTLCNSQFSVSSEICINLLRLSLHLKSEVHKENRTEHVFKQLMQQAANSQNMNTPSNIDYLYLQALLDPYPTPQYVERNKQFIVKNGSNFKCILCNANLKVSTDPQSTILELSAHFEIGFHNGKKVDHEKHSIQNASNITLGSQANSVSWPSSSFLNANKEDLQSLEAVLGTFPRVIEQNKQYIVKLGNHFKCVLCNEQLKVLSDPAKTVSQFTQHFHSIFHKQNRINHNIYLEAQSAKPIPKSPPTTSKQNTITQQEKDYLNLKILLGPYSNLSIIEQNKQFIVKDGNHFKCTLCDASISISSKIATVSKKLMEHFEGKAHKKKEKMSKDQNIQSGNLKENLVQSESNVNNKTSSDKHKSDFLSLKAFLKPYPIPEIFEKNKDCIVRDGGDFKCTLCNVPLKLLSDVSTTVQQFSQHLKGAKHKRLFKLRFAKVGVKLEKGMHSTLYTDNETPDYMYLKEILHPLKIPRIFEQNKGYLVKKGNNFGCILCDAQLTVSTVASNIVNAFSKHLNSANHKCKQRNFEAVKVNSLYLSQSGSNFECSLCKTKLGTTSNFQNMIHQCLQHFIGVNHVKNVQALSNIKTTTSDKKQSQPSNVSSSRSADCNKDVSGLKEVLQVNVLPQIIAQNRDYIVKSGDHYLCSLCKAQLSISPCASSTIHQFSQHLSSNRHCGKVAALKNTLPTASSETELSKNPSNNTQHTTNTSILDQVSNSLKEVFYPYNIPHTIKVNLSHIRKMGDHYACVACGVQLSVTSRPYFTILNFVQHLGSKNHTSKVSKPVRKS